MIIAGVDGATRTGFAVIEGPRLLHWESHRPKGDTDAEIFRNFRVWLRAGLVAYAVEAAAYEEPLRTDLSIMKDVEGDQSGFDGIKSHGRVKAPVGTMRTFLRLYGIRAHAIEIFESLNLIYDEIHNRTWRSGIYGKCSPPKGTANTSEWWKKKAIDHCSKVMKWEVSSKDAAEAALIAEFYRCQLNPRLAQANDLFTSQGTAI